MNELTQSYIAAGNVDVIFKEIELYDNIPFDKTKSNEEQIFFCLGHYDENTEITMIKNIISINNGSFCI